MAPASRTRKYQTMPVCHSPSAFVELEGAHSTLSSLVSTVTNDHRPMGPARLTPAGEGTGSSHANGLGQTAE